MYLQKFSLSYRLVCNSCDTLIFLQVDRFDLNVPVKLSITSEYNESKILINYVNEIKTSLLNVLMITCNVFSSHSAILHGL